MAIRKKNITEAKGTILLVTATKAEAIYFSQMRKDCRYMNLTVECADVKDLTLKHLIDATSKRKLSGKYQHVWCLFGFDEVGTDVDEVRQYEEYARKKKINLCYFNPCFELWFLLHLAQPSAFVQDEETIRGKVAQAIPGFSMSPEFLLTKGLNLHLQLFSRHATADLNARNYNDKVEIQTGLLATTMPLFDECIQTVCGKADMSHNQKAFK